MTAEDVVDNYSGMISKDMANDIINKEVATAKKATIKDILSGKFSEGDIVDIECLVYRVFNIRIVKKSGSETAFRNVVLSSDGNVITLALRRKSAEMVDMLGIERGDLVDVNGAIVTKDQNGFALSSSASTYLIRVKPSGTGIIEYSLLRSGDKDIDVIGKITSIGPIKYFVGLNGKQNSVTHCIISDNNIELPLVLWGSSGEAVQKLHPGDFVKIEFAVIKERNGTIEVHANEFSRILASSSFKKRLATSGHSEI